MKRDPITANVSIVEQSYCRGDADLFTVSLELKVEALNLSKSPVYVLWPMVPFVGKVASSLEEAEDGHFLYEVTWSHYYPEEVPRFDRLQIEPGKKVTVQTGYDLIARRDPAFSYPKSLAAGTYALVLVLSPEGEPPAQMKGPDTVRSMTTEPFAIEIPPDPNVVTCEASVKAE